MFDAPVDALLAWFGVAAVSIAVLGVAAGLTVPPEPDATGAADTVDAIAGGTYPATAEHGLAADRLKLTPTRVALRSGDRVARERFLFDPVTPVGGDDRLRRVLGGQPPSHQFEDPEAFTAAVAEARETESSWRPAPDRLRVRQVHWEDTRVTLVG
jgi:hypothetical protein